MSPLTLAHSINPLVRQAQTALEQNQQVQALLLYEQLIEIEPAEIEHVWFYGLCQLLMGQEAEAQLTWMMVIAEMEPSEREDATQSLVNILRTEAERQAAVEAWQIAWAIRQYIHELLPTDLHNLLHLIRLSVRLNLFDGEYLDALGLLELLQNPCPSLDQSLLLEAVEDALMTSYSDSRIQKMAEAAFAQVGDPLLLLNAFAVKVLQLSNKGLKHDPNNFDVVQALSRTYDSMGRYMESVEAARKMLPLSRTLDKKMISLGFLAVRLLRTGSCWDEVKALLEQQMKLLPELIQQYTSNVEQPLDPSLLTLCSFYHYYLSDAPVPHRNFQNQLAELVQTDLRFQANQTFTRLQKQLANRVLTPTKKLKIGYIARYMRKHSVGWLARWLMQHHDRDRFDIHTYHIHTETISSFTEQWFIHPVTLSTVFDGSTWEEVATHICEKDEIDILVDLDSLTYSDTCAVMALKPAPIQVSWLGFDTSGISAIDYFLADPYVLPESAQSYYTEKIWRLPNTYIAIDGFEIGTPSLRRDHLGIATDAVVYFSSQDGRKRHPEMMRLQMKILREVPNSYLLIKGLGDEASIQESFRQIAEEEGVENDRLRFLKFVDSELTHRANLEIADVVLDTYPYNGATTTLETLWVGIPLVTQVGQQWAARNSYAFMTNAGIPEGIAWNDEEYLEWGVRLGKDAALRQQIRWKLLQSRQTSPLWNTKQFAHEMENAYEQMWQIYLQQRG
jgi:predicted O-linked N-acetylglucosamine transferase (SPINDLY family)